MRHGFAEAYSSEEYLQVRPSSPLHVLSEITQLVSQALEKNYFLYWTDPRHERAGQPKPPSTNPADQRIDWRNRDRIRTAAAVLVVCLRIGYDPPDVIKTDPCAKLECWVDPYALAKEKAMERIGKNLQHQFESLAATPKTRYKQYLDPPVEDAKKFCTAARKSAKNERVLFYYNGHGVPKPTPSGELWLFNKQYTQYIPVSLADVVAWLGSPTIMIWDCSAAGNIVVKVEEFGIKRDMDLAREAANPTSAPSPPPPPAAVGTPGSETPPIESKPTPPIIPFRETIQLGACLGHETLPMNPDLPADLFTCCLTSPIEIALRFFLLRNPLKTNLNIDMLLKIPGKLNDRRTPLGELTWIFTAVTDTIAWNTLPRELFQKLFRHDLVVAALFRGFLLAERIMRFYECTPISVPALPQTHTHPLWDSWDLAVDMCLAQLPTLLEHEKRWLDSLPPQPTPLPDQPPLPLPPGPPLPYVHSTFFAEQLTAFEIWLEQGSVAKRQQPEQLPVVLQVLLSQAHRLKALILLCKFLDLGPWAVNVALSIGIFAYVLRLLQAPAAELKPVLIYIWARILAVYENCKEDLLKQTYPPTRSVDQAPYTYFINVLAPTSAPLPIPNVSEHRAMCAFILSICCRDYKPGQVASLRSLVFEACLIHTRDPDPLLRQWSTLCIAQMWDDFDEAKGLGVRLRAHELFCSILHTDDVPEVRASVLYALGTLLGTTGSNHAGKKFGRSIASSGVGAGLSAMEATDVELGVAMSTLKCSSDGSPVVRRELVILLSTIVNEHGGQFIIAAYKNLVERVARMNNLPFPPEEWRKSRKPFNSTVEGNFSIIANGLLEAAESEEGPSNPAFQATMFGCMFKCLFDLVVDPHSDVASLAQGVMDEIFTELFESELGPLASELVAALLGGGGVRGVGVPIEAGTVLGNERNLGGSNVLSGATGLLGGATSTTGKRGASSIGSAIKSIAALAGGTSTSPASLLAGNESTGSRISTSITSFGPKISSSSSSRITNLVQSPESTSSPAASFTTPSTTIGEGGGGGLHQSASTDSLRYLQSKVGLPTSSSSGLNRNGNGKGDGNGKGKKLKIPPRPNFENVQSIMERIIERDEERLRRRRSMPTTTTTTTILSSAPLATSFSNGGKEGGGGREGEEKKQVLPYKSHFFDFSLEYYTESQMKVSPFFLLHPPCLAS